MKRDDATSALDVVLVGRRLPDNENLGLGYLLASLHASGLRGEVLRLNDLRDVERAWTRIREARPAAVGISLPDGGSAFLPLGFGELLRRRGYGGHVTAGGPFATLARSWLLERHPWLDSVVRFAGEVPLVRLVEALPEGEAALDRVPGLTTRRGDGAPSPVLGPQPLTLTPERGELPQVLGHPMVHIAATRGCPGRCAYCGPAALQGLEWSEGRASGASTECLHASGVGGTRRRDLGAVCDEMAALRHERGVRYFYFVDEHVLPHGEGEALAFLDRWGAELRRRRAGDIGIGCMLRGDLLTPAVCRSFREAGLVRCYVGVELVTREERRRFGRPGSAERAAESIRNLDELGVATISNVMLVHPYSTPDTIRAGIEYVAALGDANFETTDMRAFHGTRLWETLRDEGRLEGNPLRYGYRHLDARVARFAELLVLLRAEAFGDYSTSFRQHDLALSVALGRRLHPAAIGATLAEAARRSGARLNAVRVGALREALALAERGLRRAEALALVGRTRTRADELTAEIERLYAAVATAVPRRGRLFAPMRAAAARAMRFCVVAAPLAAAGCYSSRGDSADGDADAAIEAAEGDAAGETDAAADDGCTEAHAEEQQEAGAGIVDRLAPCTSLWVTMPSAPSTEVSVTIPSWYDFSYCEGSEDWAAALQATVRDALAAAPLECARPWGRSFERDDIQEVSRGAEAVFGACEGAFATEPDAWYHVVIVVGADGRVTDVRSRAGYTVGSEILDCIRAALGGLVFPCLAGREVCPEYVFVE
ncbi:MAG: radical SAM protein [Deltaproteobacteria bacterium]|nr:radical SAM protein [Deltaproteobacteria bacterium]